MKVYIANRAEIASRLISTAERMGIETLVGYAEVDQDLPFVRQARRSQLIKAEQPLDAYLNRDRVIETALALGATHLHPGYGFLSENADFVRKLESAGLQFIGPSAEAIDQLGDKIGSRHFLKKIGVPLLPSYEGEDQSEERLLQEAKEIGFPLLIKPSAGGGGKGMEIVREEAEFIEALRSSKRVARAAFGDERVFIERFIEQARHIEVQVLADQYGEVRAVGERECSLQRRHQKLIEECPCVFLPSHVRDQILERSCEIAKAVQYESAGTVEWIWDGEDGVYFLEVNTRLQVEHPVTEMVFQIDLVEWQYRIARGESLKALAPLEPEGHSIEMRICAEDPENQFLPTGGVIHRLSLPEDVRVDFGYAEGNRVGSHFDSMLGKVIVHATSRADAIKSSVRALENLILLGPKTNRAYLRQLLRDERVKKGQIFTRLLSDFEYRFDVAKALQAVKSLKTSEPRGLENEKEELDWYSPWGALPRSHRHQFFEDFGDRRYYFFPFADWSEKISAQSDALKTAKKTRILEPEILSPMPAKVSRVLVKEGEVVQAGQVLLIVEAMKMEHKIKAAADAKVLSLHVTEGEQVDAEAMLLRLEFEDERKN